MPASPSDQSRPAPSTLTGLLVVDKPYRLSSMSIVRVVRRRAGKAKTGHTGTLDPLATGVLVLCLGKATKFCQQIMAMGKTYEAVIDLSGFSSTDDLEGQITPAATESLPDPRPDRESIGRLLTERFTGTIMQKPPAFSAMWVNGKRAYQLARGGDEVNLEARPVRIDALEILEYQWPILTLRVHCGKGTYIRSLARDIGVALGTGGHLTALRRTRVGPFNVESGHAWSLDDVPDPLLQEHLLPAEILLEASHDLRSA